MNIHFSERINIDEALSDFKKFLNDELSKRQMKNRGKLFKFWLSDEAVTFGDNQYLCDQSSEFFSDYQKLATLCKKEIYNFYQGNHLKISLKENGGKAKIYEIYRM
jgi:hypothetical protein